MSRAPSLWERLCSGGRISGSVTLGAYTKIARSATIGERVRLGHWSHVGDGSRIGPETVFGPWARVGANVTIGARVRLGSHTRVQDGVTIPDEAIFLDGDLVTRDGVILDRTGGTVISPLPGAKLVSARFGWFLIPLEPGENEETVDRLVDDHQWGRSDALEPCRVLRTPRPDEMEEAVRIVRARQRLHRRRAELLAGVGRCAHDPEPDPDPCP